MARTTAYLGCALAMGGLILAAGCQAPRKGSEAQHMPRITRLVEKATATPNVHRFRKPLRDERARARRELSAECDRMVADLRARSVSAEALTGSLSEGPEVAATDVNPLETALERLSAAARTGDTQGMRSAYEAALSAYTAAQKQD